MPYSRNLLEQIAKGSIILADRYYCSYFMIALLQEHGVDVVHTGKTAPTRHMRMEFQRGRRFSPDDHLVAWV